MKMTLKSFVLVLGLVSSTFVVKAQDSEKIDTLNVHEQRISLVEDGLFQLKKLKFNGYLEAQWQSSQVDSLGNGTKDMKVGAGKNAAETTDYNRFGIRRGRLKATYEDFGCQGVLELDINEKAVAIKDVYLNIVDPWSGVIAFKAGFYDRPFGYEIAYSSSRLESPERSRIIQTLFPDEKDLGGMLTIQAPKTSPWNVLKLEAGLFAGNGIYTDSKSKKDFIGHLTYTNSGANYKYGLGMSVYSGFIAQPDTNIYVMNNGAFVRNAGTKSNGFSDRRYLGFDSQFSIGTDLGLSKIRAEYLMGTQPGSNTSSNSPNGILVVTGDTYLRNFAGGYVHFVQDIADTKHSIEVKYDWYDPNTNIAGSQIGIASKTGKADMAYSTIGLGYIYRMNNNITLTAYYDIVTNETTKVKGYFKNVNDNLLTIRLQYKF